MIADSLLLHRVSPYLGYAYSYPHKSAYRALDPAIPLGQAWQEENRDALFLYVHVPFCEFRCGFCNLFTLANAETGLTQAYLQQLRLEARAVADSIGAAVFAQAAIGGGTPTFLSEHELADLLDIAGGVLGGPPAGRGVSCEASPATFTLAKARLLASWGVSRISLGVQSFDDAESRALGRPQSAVEVLEAVALARHCEFPLLNLDLIYGLEGQSLASWLKTVEKAVELKPEEIYLYPLYVRELTGLGRTGAAASDSRLRHFREARSMLQSAGYEQKSLRMFSLPPTEARSVEARRGPSYRCQSDGMIGLGCGARSYTRGLHYSTEFAVGRSGVRSILGEYLTRDETAFAFARHGVELDGEEQRRRFVIQSLLQAEGLSRGEYLARFQTDALHDLPQLKELVHQELAILSNAKLRLTPQGLEMSDAIGPWLYSNRMKRRMEEFECL